MLSIFSKNNFNEEIYECTLPILIGFSAEWCLQCIKAAETAESIAKKYEGTIKAGIIDTDHDPQLAAAFGIKIIPQFLIIKDKEVAARIDWPVTEEELTDKIERTLYPEKFIKPPEPEKTARRARPRRPRPAAN